MFLILKLFIFLLLFYSSTLKSSDYIYIESENFSDLKVKLAIDIDDKMKGLMYLEELKSYEGMLFIYEIPQKVTIWMHNTFIPLDIVFIDENNEVYLVKIGVPESKKLISSEIKVRAVLEIPRNCAKKVGISKGDKINWYKNKKNQNKEYYHCIDS